MRQRQKFRHRAVAVADAEHSAIEAMRTMAAEAQRAMAARRVDLADDALSLQRPRLSHTDKLVAEDALKVGVAFGDLDVRVTDAREQDAHERFALGRSRIWKLAGE